MALKKVYIGSVGPFVYDDEKDINDPDGDFSGETQQAIRTDGAGIFDEEGGVNSLQLNDSDSSNILDIIWNEDDSSDRTLNVKVNASDQTLDLPIRSLDIVCNNDQVVCNNDEVVFL